jgi:hypothetical protein
MSLFNERQDVVFILGNRAIVLLNLPVPTEDKQVHCVGMQQLAERKPLGGQYWKRRKVEHIRGHSARKTCG